MVKKVFAMLLAVSVSGALGCAGNATTNTGGRAGDKKDQVTITSWKAPIILKHGNTQETKIAISRGKDFTDTVTFKLTDDKKGLKFDPATPKIENNANETDLKILAEDSADVGEHKITVTGTPSKGGEAATQTFNVKVTAKE